MNLDGLITIGLGIYLIIIRRVAARWAVRFNSRLFGPRFKESMYEGPALVVGLLFVLVGVLQLIGFIQLNK